MCVEFISSSRAWQRAKRARESKSHFLLQPVVHPSAAVRRIKGGNNCIKSQSRSQQRSPARRIPMKSARGRCRERTHMRKRQKAAAAAESCVRFQSSGDMRCMRALPNLYSVCFYYHIYPVMCFASNKNLTDECGWFKSRLIFHSICQSARFK